jgi:hypothetical protein
VDDGQGDYRLPDDEGTYGRFTTRSSPKSATVRDFDKATFFQGACRSR